MKEAYLNLTKEAEEQKKTNEAYFKSIRAYKNPQTIELLKQNHNEVFSEIDCLSCANCCKTSPPIVTNRDKKRIANHLNMPPKQFERKYIIEDVNGEKSFSQVPCFFLQSDNQCSIYEVRPEACRRYPHTDEDDYFLRSSLNLKNTLICPAALLIFNKMKSKLDIK